MTDLFRGYAPANSKASFADTVDTAIRRLRSATGDNGPIVVTAHPSSVAGLTAPLGVTIETDARVPVGNVWLHIPEDDRAVCPECGAAVTVREYQGTSPGGSDYEYATWECRECEIGGDA